VRLSVAIFGDEEAKAMLDGVAERARDLTPAWDRLLPQLRAHERTLFATRGHGQWPANRPGTVRQKGRNTPMVDTGRLLKALTANRATGSLTRRSRTQLLFGVRDTGALYYTRFVGKDRPFILSEKEAERIATRAVRDWLSR
jgi:hypothetical protein